MKSDKMQNSNPNRANRNVSDAFIPQFQIVFNVSALFFVLWVSSVGFSICSNLLDAITPHYIDLDTHSKLELLTHTLNTTHSKCQVLSL
jgi:hypothetical protein